MKIAYLGPKNSFSFQAASQLGEENEFIPYPSIPMCLQALKSDALDYALVPIENSLEGSVHATVDQFFQTTGLVVLGEIILPIRQQLLVNPGTILPGKILSHPQALAQSQQFLESHFPEVPMEAVSSTTFAAEWVANHPDKKYAAIASEEAAKEYSLEILGKDIQDNAYNQTRFWIVGNEKQQTFDFLGPTTKMTLFVTLPANLPGALHKVLSTFAWRNIDLTKVESRPLKTNLGEYFFIIELTVDENEALIEQAIKEMESLKIGVRLIGHYPIKICS